MKIFILGPAYPYRGGIADTNESLARALQEQGHEVKIFTFKLQYPNFLFPGKTQMSEEITPTNLKIERLINSLNPLSWFLTANKINKTEVDLVIIRYWLPFLAPCLGTIARMLNKKIKVIGFCDNILPHEKRFGDYNFSKYFISACDGFITMSKTVQNELKIFSNKASICIHHPINDNLGKKIPKLEARKILNLKENGKYILFFGLVRQYKGLDLLLTAMNENILKSKDIQLIVAGEFYDDKQKYLNYISENQLSDKVILIDKFIPTEEIKNFFSAADLVAQTYHSASQSGVSQLAFNFDCPILVTNVGGLSETVPHMKVGYVVEKDEKKIALHIVDFFEKSRATSFTENIKKIKYKYSWTTFANKVVEFSEKLKI